VQVGDGDPARQLHNGQRKGGKMQKQSIISNRVAQAADQNIWQTIQALADGKAILWMNAEIKLIG